MTPSRLVLIPMLFLFIAHFSIGKTSTIRIFSRYSSLRNQPSILGVWLFPASIRLMSAPSIGLKTTDVPREAQPHSHAVDSTSIATTY